MKNNNFEQNEKKIKKQKHEKLLTLNKHETFQIKTSKKSIFKSKISFMNAKC